MNVPSDIVLQACGFVWPHLPPESRRAVRATCRGGRLLHDSLATQLQLHLGPLIREHEIRQGPEPPTPAELRAGVSGVLRRGARLGCLELLALPCFEMELPAERERQLWAVLKACSGHPIRSLFLAGAIPNSTKLSKAMATAIPYLARLKLKYVAAVPRGYVPYAESRQDVQAAYGRAVSALLSLVGPRLGALEATGSAHFWPRQCFAALQQCTALTSLTLEAGRREEYRELDLCLDSMATESRILSSVCQLTRLRSLHLTTNVPARACGLAAVAPHAQTLTQLSALTSLTSLDLVLPACYRPVADRWSRWKFREKDCQAWQALWSTQRSSLLLALRRMPGLEHLGCRDLWMDPSELVPLTALTSLTLGGLMPLSQPELPPSEGMAPWSLPAQGMADWALPQQLQELHLADGASPSILRLLQLPPSLRRIRASALCFGMYDTAEGVVLPRAVQAVGTAVRLLVRHAGNVDPSFIVAADCGPDPMEPSEEGAVSHTEWISHLAGLSPAVTKLEIRHVQLRVGDVACLASALPHLKKLVLKCTHVPMSALFALTSLQQLAEVHLDLSHFSYIAEEELVGLLSLLIRQVRALGAVEVAVTAAAHQEGLEHFFSSVQEQLEAWGINDAKRMTVFVMT